ncbi:hypothetical protein NA56DRAFT_665302 [Hyaloscypha hepaticicola]|uniref:Uncharacterized protein n=1 Tax=Hyaloscypha hepaticicola TaxID=2082293 RepID=A0A2J6PI22_9HELO|nr:hypothetical protein NA56DRAFT_665302 [Hyaloscypha hepaticicola]
MPLILTIIPAYIEIHDHNVETPTSIFASPSPTTVSPFETTTTSPSPTATNSENSRWLFRSWDDTTTAFTVIFAAKTPQFFTPKPRITKTCSTAYLKSRRGSRNARQFEEQTDETAAARQNKWYNRLKRRTSSNSSQNRSPEGTPLGDVRTGSRSQASSHQINAVNAPSQMDQPPAYTRPATPPLVMLNLSYNSTGINSIRGNPHIRFLDQFMPKKCRRQLMSVIGTLGRFSIRRGGMISDQGLQDI